MVKAITQTKAVKKQTVPNREELEVAAYYHWLGRGCPQDDPLTDWKEAEAELAHSAETGKK